MAELKVIKTAAETALAQTFAQARAKRAGMLLDEGEALRLVFADGAFVPELSDTAALEDGLSVTSLAAALADNDQELTRHLGKLAPTSDVAVALNTALMGDGAVIRVRAGATIKRPLHLVFAASEKPGASFTRSLMMVGEGARVMLVES